MSTKHLSITGLLLTIFFLGLYPLLNPTDPSTNLSTPILKVSRSFGYGVGDLVEHQISVSAPLPYVLENTALPQPGSLNTWLYLRHIDIKTEQQKGRNHYQIQITYQLFQGVKKATQIKIPPLPLQFMDVERKLSTQIPAWILNYAPLIPATTTDASVQIRPTLSLPQTNLSESMYTFTLLLLACLCTALYAAWRFDLLPFLHHGPRPFAQAYKQLKRLDHKPTAPETYLAALKIVHQAFNHSAGHTVFFERLDEFYQQKPGFCTFRRETEQFFRASQQAFFSPDASLVQLSFQQLEILCQRHRNIECLCR